MLVALTGASGFVGSYTAAALAGAGHRVRALVRPTSRRDHIEKFVSEWRVGEQDDPQTQAALVAGVEAVIHNAADWGALRQSPTTHFRRNVLGSLGLLEATRAAGAEQFIFVSSVAVYHEILPDRPLNENHPAWPANLYGAYKASIESYLKAYHTEYGLNTSAWRPAAVYGIDPDLKRSQWYEWIKTAREGGAIDTDQGGKITHVQDVADALCLAVGDAATAGQFYNLVDRHMYWQEAAEFAREISGSSARIEQRKGPGPKNHFDTKKAIEFFTRHGNARALRRGLDGVKEYVRELLGKI